MTSCISTSLYTIQMELKTGKGEETNFNRKPCVMGLCGLFKRHRTSKSGLNREALSSKNATVDEDLVLPIHLFPNMHRD